MYLFKNQLTTCMFLIILSLLGSIVVKQNKSCNWSHEWETTCFILFRRARWLLAPSSQAPHPSTAALRK